MAEAPEVSVVVVSWNTRDLLAQCLDSVIADTAPIRRELIVVDNASADGSPDLVRERYPEARLMCNQENVGFARAVNQAARAAQSRYLLLVNSDAELSRGALSALVTLADSQPRAAVVGARLLYPDGRFQASHNRFPGLGRELLVLSGLGRLCFGPWYPSYGPEEDTPRRADWVGGACMLARRDPFLAAGGLDEQYFMYAEEMDLCYTLWQSGWEVWYQPAAQVLHAGGASARREVQRLGALYCSQVRFFRKRYGPLAAALLKLEIYLCVAAKSAIHALLQRCSGGRWGRSAVSLRHLLPQLRQA